MITENLKSGYLVATNQRTIRIYNTLKEAEEHVNYQRKIGSTKTWYIVEIQLSNWKTFKA